MTETAARPAIWVLLGRRLGDNNQAIALAELLGLPFIEKALRYTAWRHAPRHLGFLGFRTIDAATRQTLVPPWPALVIGVGKRSAPVARVIRARSGGKTRIVQMGDPRSPPRWFDLVVTTPQYRMPPAPNVLVLPLALAKGIGRHDLEEARPATTVFLVGGPSWPWFPDEAAVLAAARARRAAADRDGGAVLALTSQRTAEPLREALRDSLGADNVDRIDYRAAVARGTAFFVTADSVSMLSDAIVTGRPVAMLPVTATPLGQWWVRTWRRLRPTAPLWPRDLPRFWASIEAHGLIGTADMPRAGEAIDVAALVRARVAPLLSAGL
jgi:mitochondrial fission protein ELM1